MEAQGQLQNLLQMLMKMHVPVSNECDIMSWKQSSQGVFSMKSFYLFIKQGPI
jgi:hypothetical protein